MINMTNIVLPRSLLKPSLVLSLVGFALCYLSIGTVFIDFEVLSGLVFMFLFFGIFPLWFGAVFVMTRRMKNQRGENPWKVLFRGLPRWFYPAFHCYFYVIVLGMLAGFIQAFRGKPGWIGLAFVLIPSVFYLGCIGAYWSELRERVTDVPGVPPLLIPPQL
jgi:hypothetical protein